MMPLLGENYSYNQKIWLKYVRNETKSAENKQATTTTTTTTTTK